MNTTSPVTLKRTSLVKIAGILIEVNNKKCSWGSTALKIIADFNKVANDVISKSYQFDLPMELRKELNYVIHAIIYDIKLWKEMFIEESPKVKWDYAQWKWSPVGTLDKKKTAQLWVRSSHIMDDIYDRFRLACVYCVEDAIYVLWQKSDFYSRDLISIRRLESRIVSFWCHYLEGKLSLMNEEMREYCEDEMATPFVYGFLMSARNGNDIAAKFFWERLTSRERQKILVETVSNIAGSNSFLMYSIKFFFQKYSKIVAFLLTNMNEEQQQEMLKKETLGILKCFLDWPRQEYFMELVEKAWPYISEDCFRNILKAIIYKITYFKDYDYRDIFTCVWRQSSFSYRKHFIKDQFLFLVLWDLVVAKDEKNFQMVLLDASSEEKEKLFFIEDSVVADFETLFSHSNLQFIRYIIFECLKTKESLMQLKNALSFFKTTKCTLLANDEFREKLEAIETELNIHIAQFE